MGLRLAVMVVALVVALAPRASARRQEEHRQVTKRVLALFEAHRNESIDAFLTALRPVPLDDESRAKVVASLPAKGEVQPSKRDAEKLRAAERILDYSARRDAIALKVVSLDSAFVGLYYRTVVLISARALAILTADELAALVAHELGHDDDWNAYWDAMQAHDSPHMQELELKADGIAVLTLVRLSIDPERLASAIQKMMRENGWRDRAPGATPIGNDGLVNGDRYVALPDRIEFIHAVAHLPWAHRPAGTTALPQ